MNDLKSRIQQNIVELFAGHPQWSAVRHVCSTLRAANFEALLAGGSVRDLLMGRRPHDFDIATDATPDQVEALFSNAIGVGKAFGVMIVPFEGFHIEVATFRQDFEYKDGRRPESVSFSDAKNDAERRDFTVNALFYNPETENLIDYFDGVKDLDAGLIRAVGDPERRFTEDHLRMVRAARFVAQLSFKIAPETLGAISRLAHHVSSVSRERVRDEVLKLLKSPNRRAGLECLRATGLLKVLFPDLASRVDENPDRWLDRLARAGDASDASLLLALFFLPHFEQGETQSITDECLRDLRLDNATTKNVLFALKHYRDFLRPEKLRQGELILLLMHSASGAARSIANILESEVFVFGAVGRSEREMLLAGLEHRVMGSAKQKPTALITGDDAKANGVPPGRAMGELLHEAYLLQLEGVLDTRENALGWLREKTRPPQS